MFDLDKALAAWRRTLETNPTFTTDDIDELERHLRDEIHTLMVHGLDEETAYRQAIQHFGAYRHVEAAYQSVYWGKAQRLGSLAQALGVRTAMWKTYFKLAYRNLLKDKLSTGINVLGFATAIACCILVFVYLHQQANLDTFHADVERIFQVQQVLDDTETDKLRLGPTPVPLGPILNTDFPSVERAVRVQRGQATVRVKDSMFDERILFTDPDFFDLFTFPLRYGDPNALHHPHHIVLSTPVAEKYFGPVNPVGETVTLAFGETAPETFIVGGVAAPFPNNRAFAFHVLVPFAYQHTLGLTEATAWTTTTSATFIRIRNLGDLPHLAQQLEPYVTVHQSALDAAAQIAPATSAFTFEHLTDIGKNEEEVMEALMGGSGLAEIIFMIVLAGIILLLSSTNYVNIALVSASRRIKEIGIRKVVGGTQRQLVLQFLVENVVLCTLALIGGLTLAHYVLLPGFNDLFPPHAPIFELDLLGSWALWLFLVLLLLLVAVSSGAYPALYIARFEPVAIFQGQQQFGKRAGLIRGLLVFQLAFTFIALVLPIADAEHNYKQAHRDWGYDAEDMVVAPIHNLTTYNVLANTMAQSPDVVRFSGARYHVGARQGRADIRVDGLEHQVFFYDIGEDYIETIDLPLNAGRHLQRATEHALLVNEAFVTRMGWTNPLNEEVVIGTQPYVVAGVVDNFLRRRWADAEPHFFRLSAPETFRYLVVKTRPGADGRIARLLEAQWAALNPDLPYTGFYQADVFDNHDTDPLAFVGFLTLLLSCIGNLGLVALHAARRRKEVSIRKVLGASSGSIIRLMLTSFLKQTALAFIIAIPLAYWLLQTLMDERIATFGMSPLPFFLTAILMLGTMLLTLSTQLIKATSTNPVENLRME